MINGASFNAEEDARYHAAKRRGDKLTMAAIEIEVDQRYLKEQAANEAAIKIARSQSRPAKLKGGIT